MTSSRSFREFQQRITVHLKVVIIQTLLIEKNSKCTENSFMKPRSLVVFSPLRFCRTIGICDLGTLLLLALLTVLPQIMAGKQELMSVIQGNGHFTQGLYKALSSEPGNVFFSPISAHAVLAMAYQGSKGSTQEAFTKSLGIPSTTHAAQGYKDVINYLNNIEGVELNMANRIYIMNNYALKPTFQAVTATNFQSEVESVDFSDGAGTAGKINNWVEEKTNNKIKNLIQPGSLDSLTRLVLVNAIYFKGKWASEFDKNNTKKEKFYLNDNDSIDVDMMNNKAKYFYKEDESLDAKVLELPYVNDNISLIVILPNKRNGIAELEEKLLQTDLTKITEGMYKPEVIVKLPKFKIETSIDLNEPLTKVGLGIIFDQGKADFSEMLDSKENLYVSKVVQKAFIEVNEEGTEAAAATAITFMTTSFGAPPRPIRFTADHPFIIFLRVKEPNNKAYIELFGGRIGNPGNA